MIENQVGIVTTTPFGSAMFAIDFGKDTSHKLLRRWSSECQMMCL